LNLAIFTTFRPPRPRPCITSYSILSCITHRTLSTHQILFKSENNILWTDGRMCLRPAL